MEEGLLSESAEIFLARADMSDAIARLKSIRDLLEAATDRECADKDPEMLL